MKTDTETAIGTKSVFLQMQEKMDGKPNIRAKILFDEYPDLEKATTSSDKLRKIYNQKNQKLPLLMQKLAHWFNEVEASGLNHFHP